MSRRHAEHCDLFVGQHPDRTSRRADDQASRLEDLAFGHQRPCPKAWIEMVHRYLAMTVGVLILVMAVFSWLGRQRLPFSPWWPTVTREPMVNGAPGSE